MRARTFILLAFAVIAAGGTFYLAQNWIAMQRGALTQTAKQKAPKRGPGVFVLVAAQKLPAGQFIKAKHLRWQAWPKKGLAASYFVKGSPKPAVVKKPNAVKAGAKPVKTAQKRSVGPRVRSRSRILSERLSVPRSCRASRLPMGVLSGQVNAVFWRPYYSSARAPSPYQSMRRPVSPGFVFPGDKVDMLLTHSIR